MGRKYYKSPFGVFVHPWFNKPDTKFNAEGLFHSWLAVEGEEAEKFREFIDTATDEAWEEEIDRIKKADRAKWQKYYPYKAETDDDGKPTGRTLFNFKQNAKIRLKDGSVKPFVVGLYNAKDKPIKADVWSGSEGRVLYSPRNIKLQSSSLIGVRLDFAKVQITKLIERSAGFGETEGYDGGEYDTENETTDDADY